MTQRYLETKLFRLKAGKSVSWNSITNFTTAELLSWKISIHTRDDKNSFKHKKIQIFVLQKLSPNYQASYFFETDCNDITSNNKTKSWQPIIPVSVSLFIYMTLILQPFRGKPVSLKFNLLRKLLFWNCFWFFVYLHGAYFGADSETEAKYEKN